ncbi:LacI family DNA-binding transcriptional regulator [Thalassospira marina]|uniref:Transcriptional regulator n=1 Tax=Thalassospira marina TaxID=2048283 RepID=A0ABM6QC38_9PROT|nr:LacI family DNA-binding transcriptional regulator [Thalassospira marina]AUG54134.1 transcriptional regulator [Thalassospira marina]
MRISLNLALRSHNFALHTLPYPGELTLSDQYTARHRKTNLPTLQDVANRAGVSLSAASRALSRDQKPVAAEKRERVLAAARELGYSANPLAQGLSTRQTGLVSIIVNHIGDLSDLDLFDILIGRLQDVGKQASIVRLGSVSSARDFLRGSINYHVDAALIFSDFIGPRQARDFFRTNHVIMLNGRQDSQSLSVQPDDAPGIEQAVENAARARVETATLITGRESSELEQQRIALYRTALAKHGILVHEQMQGDYSYAAGVAAAQKIDPRHYPDTIFCTSDAMAMGVLDVLRDREAGIIPDRIRLYGFDNLSLTELHSYPISSIGFDKGDYVEQVVSLLVDHGRARKGERHLGVPTRFFARHTG